MILDCNFVGHPDKSRITIGQFPALNMLGKGFWRGQIGDPIVTPQICQMDSGETKPVLATDQQVAKPTLHPPRTLLMAATFPTWA